MVIVVDVIVLLLAGGGAGGGGGRAQQPGRGNSTGMLPTLMLIVDQCVNCPPPSRQICRDCHARPHFEGSRINI